MDESSIADEEIDALWTVLREEMDPTAYMARVRDFTDAEIQAGALRAAGEEADRKNRDLYRRALAAAWAARKRAN